MEYSCPINLDNLQIEYIFYKDDIEIYKFIIPFEKYFYEDKHVYIDDRITYTFKENYVIIYFKINITVYSPLLNPAIIQYHNYRKNSISIKYYDYI